MRRVVSSPAGVAAAALLSAAATRDMAAAVSACSAELELTLHKALDIKSRTFAS